MRFLLLAAIWLGSLGVLYAQPQVDQQLADQYYREGSYEKALIYYEKLYNETRVPQFFDRYVECLMRLENYSEAEKLLRREKKQRQYDPMVGIRLGQVYELQEDRKTAEKEWDKVIRDLAANQSEILRIAREFSNLGEYEFALKTYEQGKRLIRSFYVFNYEIAEVYGLMGRNEEMIDLYLELIEQNPSYLQNVQNMLARNIDFEDDLERVEILRTRLLRKVQQAPENTLFAEMLIWLYLQREDYAGALVQAKALDRRMSEDGRRVMNLARIAERNRQYLAALAGYDYIIQKGPEFYYYTDARTAWLSVRKQQLENNFDTPEADYRALRTSYLETLDELGQPANNAGMVRELAEIEALRIQAVDTAIQRLENLLESPRLPKEEEAMAKIELGDYLLIQGEVWQAGIRYMQAEKAYKYDVIGEQAKFKATKVYYFTGDFSFAKGQLDVLKASTSRLIANDAMYLSNLIMDNTGLDSNEVPMRMFARAELLTIQNRYEESLNTLDSINYLFPGHSLADDILYQKYKTYYQARDFEQAATALEGILEAHGDDILGDDATYLLAQLMENQLNDPGRAKDLYEKILFEYPGSLYVVEARKRFRALRGDNLN